MHSNDKTLLKALVVVAWADGRFAEEEREMFDDLLDCMEASQDDREELRRYAETPRTLEDLAVSELAEDDRRTLLSQAILMTLIDGEQDPRETALLTELASRLESHA